MVEYLYSAYYTIAGYTVEAFASLSSYTMHLLYYIISHRIIFYYIV